MARNRYDNELRITPSVFDRLIDYDPDSSLEPSRSQTETLRELKAFIRRDLEWLLNTRRQVFDTKLDLEETQRSVAVYGIPDFLGLQLSSPVEQKNLVLQVEQAIKLFAPQLLDVKISHNSPNAVDRSISFRIEAKIDVEPTPEPIVFDTVLQVGSGEFGVNEV